MNKKIRVPCELALAITVCLNSFAVTLMLRSDLGMSTIASVPYVLSQAFPVVSIGTWNYCFQTFLISILMILRKKISLSYLASFAVGVVFGMLIDLHNLWMSFLPMGFGWRVCYFAVAFAVLAVGICFANNCQLPVVPADIFPRDISEIINRPFSRVKTTVDLCCLTASVLLSLLCMHRIVGVGIGTVLCALTVGKSVSMVQKVFDRHVEFYRLTGDRPVPEVSEDNATVSEPAK